MGDFFVHVRMKECCRETLTKVDQHKKKAKHTGGVKSLHAAFSEKPIHEAKGVIPAAWGWVEDELAALVRAACEKLCEQHAEHHHGKGETQEAAYWSEIGASICGKPAPKKVTAKVEGKVASAAKMKNWDGSAVAAKAKAKAKEYGDAGVTYSQAKPFYPASTHSDCSHFVNDVLKSSGVDVPYVTTKEIGTSKHFTEVSDPQPGDVIWQPGHMGVYTGVDAKGHPLGEQMGTDGPKEGKWGPGGWFHGGDQTKYYRPVIE